MESLTQDETKMKGWQRKRKRENRSFLFTSMHCLRAEREKERGGVWRCIIECLELAIGFSRRTRDVYVHGVRSSGSVESKNKGRENSIGGDEGRGGELVTIGGEIEAAGAGRSEERRETSGDFRGDVPC